MKKKILSWYSFAKGFAKRRKKLSAVIAAAVVVLVGYGYYSLSSQTASTKYVLASVRKGTVRSVVTGSGQVAATNQTDFTSKVSGKVTYLGVKNGDEVKAGTLLVSIDDRDVRKSIRDAETSLESALLSLEKIQQPAEALSITQAENALVQAKQAKEKADRAVPDAFDDAFSSVSQSFVDLPGIMQGMENILYGKEIQRLSDNVYAYADLVDDYDAQAIVLRDDVIAKYKIARAAYDANYSSYKNVTRDSSQASIQAELEKTYRTTLAVSNAIKGMSNLIDFVKDIASKTNIVAPSVTTSHQASLSSFTSKINTHVSSLSQAKETIKNAQDSLVSAINSVNEKTQSLQNIKEGSSEFEVRSAELSVKQRQDSLQDAKDKLADYYIRAPYDGVVGKIDVTLGQEVGSGKSLVSVITKQKMATVSLNEVDIAKVKVGNPVTLTLDALEGVELKGEVADVDLIGTTSQGVVTYTARIVFDAGNNQIRPGMSVSSTIVVSSREGVLVVSNAAIKSTPRDGSYVEVLAEKTEDRAVMMQGVESATLPTRKTIETGLVGENTTEIVSGLVEGDQVITRTIQASGTAAATTAAPSLFGSGSRSTTGAVRIPR